MQNYWDLYLAWRQQQLYGPVNIIGTFEKRAPNYETNETYATESTEHKNWTKLKQMLADALAKHVFLEV